MEPEQPDARSEHAPRPDPDIGAQQSSDEPTDPWAEGAQRSFEDDSDQREHAYGLFQRGHVLMRARHHAQAAIVLERASRLEPRKGSILEALGRAYYNSGQHQRSAETFSELLEVDPSSHYAHYALGQSLKQLGRPREARTHLRLAVALSPESKLYRGALERLGPPPKTD